MKNTWIVIPAYNEAKRILPVLRKVKRHYGNVIVVDDGSVDGTSQVAKRSGAIVLRHIVNLGKGAALKTGCDYCLSLGADSIVVMDADGQHDPGDIPNFLKALKKADVVLGYRRLNENMPIIFRFGNSFINAVLYALYNIKLHDTQCGYRAFTSSAYRKIRWAALDYSMESEMIANIGRSHLVYKEIPIDTIYADRYKGTTVIDGFKIVLNMFTWRLRR
jgi:glycosyltransferase involved in cell wall biosynthesis